MEPQSPSDASTLRTLALAAALLGVAATGLAGVFGVGSAAAKVQRVEHAQRLQRSVPGSAIADAERAKWLAAALLAAAALGLAGVALLRKRPKPAAGVLFLAFAAPVPFALWAFCPATPFLAAALFALRAPDDWRIDGR